jgi:2-keto-4-pentenoate hydratase/2-oxohepta-3-ene-1,7-dioic acid hydratase in catechol pathway
LKIGRIELDGIDGPVARLALVIPEERRVIDLRRALTAILADGATREAADRIAVATFPGSMSAAIALGKRFLDAAREFDASRRDTCSLSFDSIRWLPATDPSVLRDGLTFIEHIKGFHQRMGAQPTPSLLKAPGYFKGTPWTIYGQDAEMPWPGFVEHMDYELELGFVIGRRGHNVTPEQARDYLFGVTIFNDFSARDRQAVEMPIGMGPQKCKDFAYGVGPWITTMDEMGSLESLRMEVRVNGEVWAKGESGAALWSAEELIAYVSLADWIQPGDLIGSGTFGNGSGLELGRQLSSGDVIELQVDGIGVLRNRMGQRQKEPWFPAERKPFM